MSLSIDDAWFKVKSTESALMRPHGVTRRELAEILGLSINKKRDLRCVQAWIDVAGNHLPVIEIGTRDAAGNGGNPSIVYGVMNAKNS